MDKLFVVAYGVDCDVYNSGHLYSFDSEHEAEAFAYGCNLVSDGLLYVAVDYCEAKRYARVFDKEALFRDMVKPNNIWCV